MKYLIFLTALMLSFNSIAQNQLPQTEESSAIFFQFGRNIHGTGDMPGFSYGISYEENFSKNWFYSIGFEGSLNDEKGFPFIWEDPDGKSYDSTLHSVTAGFQLNLGLGYHIIKSAHHRFAVSPNIFGRYQATSLNDLEEIQYPQLTGFEVPIKFILNESPQRTIAFGGALKLHYDYRFNNDYSVGVLGGFQIDTNGDTIKYGMFRLGRRF